MKVTLINTSDAGGGAPVASMRLLKALLSANVDARFLTSKKKTDENRVHAVEEGLISRLRARFNFYYERLSFILLHERNKSQRFAFSAANAGTNIASHPLVTGADVLHLHWTNSGFLSIADLKALIKTGKPIIWTLHDMWTFTGGCHYSGPCDHFINSCGDCYFLRDCGIHDASYQGWLRKEELYSNAENITFVPCSHWLGNIARQSSLLRRFKISPVPNPIDTSLYIAKDKAAMRRKWKINTDKKIVLFGAANINDRRKGISYLIAALTSLKRSLVIDIEIVIFGKNTHLDLGTLPFRVYALNIITSQEDLVEIYSMADVFVMPSIEDNLPNTVMESLACGTPVVAFNCGGLPEMIDHQKNGYLAEFKSSADFASGIEAMLFAANPDELSANARKKVLDHFTNERVAQQYIDLYQSALTI